MSENGESKPKKEFDYFDKKRSDRVYISKSFKGYDLTNDRTIRIASKIIESDDQQEIAIIRNELVVRTTQGGKQEVKVIFYDDTRSIHKVIFQRFTVKNGKPHKQSFSFTLSEFQKIIDLLRTIETVPFDSEGKLRLDDSVIQSIFMDDEQKRKYLTSNIDILEEVARNSITKKDIIALGYRKQQLDVFNKLLNDKNYFKQIQNDWGKANTESVWQKYFENNQWIFGYGLNYIFITNLDDKKLEQYTSGYYLFHSGKRTDALMKTSGLINALCFVEIKTHLTPLLKTNEPYRPDCWQISNELSGSISQMQKTIQRSLESIKTKIESTDKSGFPRGEVIFNYQPRSFIVIGSLSEFANESGANESQFGSFELFRRNINNPEIITFDELFARAKFIVQQSEDESSKPTNESTEEDIPF
jgi:hypothetical protein